MSNAPEARLQIDVKRFLGIALAPAHTPGSIIWTASLAGHGKLSMAARNKAKAMGLQPGWPDLQFLFPDGVTRYVELKSATGSLTPEQRDFRARTERHNIFAVCRSVEEVETALRAWGARLRASTGSAAVGAAQDRGQGYGPGS